MELIEYKNVCVGYVPGKNILENVSFSLQKGSVTTLLGPNGSGKSTLMMTMNKLIKPSSGEIIIDNVNVSSLSTKEIARKIAFVPQFSDTSFSFSVEEAILWGRAPYISYLPQKSDMEIVDDVIGRFGLEHLRNKDFNEISGGERQMVLIARAIAQQTPIVLMDEPATYLDIYNQRKILNVIKDLNVEEGVTFVITLHDPNHAMYISDNVIMFKNKEALYGTKKEMMSEDKLRRLYGVTCNLKEESGKEYIYIDYE